MSSLADSARTDMVLLEPLVHPGGETWHALLSELPIEERQALARSGGRQERFAVLARQAETLVGLAFGCRRPCTGAIKLARLWAPQDLALAQSLLTAFEQLAEAQGARLLKLEEPPDFALGKTQLAAAGYLPLAAPPHGGAGASGWIKPLRPGWPPAGPYYYAQTAGMTCGPCALGMALSQLGAAPALDRPAEFQLWREATTVYGAAGPGGCDPFGLALAAVRRGLRAEVFLNSEDAILLDRASNEERREIMRFVQQGFRAEALAQGVPLHGHAFTLAEIGTALDRGAVALLLIDEDMMHAEGGPHWVLAFARYGDCWLVQDPWLDAHLGETWVDGSHLAIPQDHLDRMCRYGDPACRSAVLLTPGEV